MPDALAASSPKQFTVGVLNATLDLAALVLFGVAVFFASEMVLAPLAPFMSGWVLVGVAGYMQVFDQITRFNLNLLKLFGSTLV